MKAFLVVSIYALEYRIVVKLPHEIRTKAGARGTAGTVLAVALFKSRN